MVARAVLCACRLPQNVPIHGFFAAVESTISMKSTNTVLGLQNYYRILWLYVKISKVEQRLVAKQN
jgi:hypothetical protein